MGRTLRRRPDAEPEHQRSGSVVDGESGGAHLLGGVLAVLAACVISAHVLGAGRLGPALWGADAYGYFPAAVLASSLAALTLIAVLVVRAVRTPSIDAAPSGAPTASSWRPFVIAAAGLATFWLLRIRHTWLGDGHVLTQDLPKGLIGHPHQPLTVFLHHVVYQSAHGWFEAAGKPAADVARDTVALSSAVAGALFVVVAWALGRALVAPAHPGPASDAGRAASRDRAAAAPDRGAAWLVTGLIVSQGYVQLFFGYVENYTFFALALAAYLLAAMACLRGRGALLAPGAILVVAVGLHLSAAIMLPSYVVLVVAAWRRGRARTLRDLAVTLALLGALQLALAAIQPGYSLIAKLVEVFGLAARGHGEAGRLAYLFSFEHWRDFLNEQFLIGPLAALLFVPAALLGLARGGGRSATAWFFAAAGAVALASAWFTTELNLGYPRDWDLFAPYAVVYTTGAAFFVVRAIPGGAARRALLGLAVVLSLFHTAPWIALNASFERSFARFKNLPLGRGRTESTIGVWYLTHDQPDSARTWFDRSVAVYPDNNIAQYYLGLLAMDDDRYDVAVARLAAAARLRPGKDEYRLRLADALVMAGRPADALLHLEALTARAPRHASYWACTGVVLAGLQRIDAARAALDRAVQLAPEDPLYAELRANVARPDLYDTVVRETWFDLVTR